MKNPKEFIDRTIQFLNQQREMYGDFSAELPAAVSAEEQAEPETTSAKEEVSADNAGPQEKPEETVEELLKKCSTLEELKAFCAQQSELRTDLENTNLVFGVGNPNAELMIIGEAPGFNEDKQGEPFVGEAGQLLDKIMDAIDLKREEIYIANILKHRPPDNRNPNPDEIAKSLPYLYRQIELVNPKLILAVGKTSANSLLGTDTTLGKLRNQFHSFRGRELLVTYHPAALLYRPKYKRPTWEDVQKLRKRYDELVDA